MKYQLLEQNTAFSESPHIGQEANQIQQYCHSRNVEQYLATVFEAAGPCPFDPQPLAYTKRKTMERIMQLHTNGCSATDIAASVNVSAETVQRHIKRWPEQTADDLTDAIITPQPNDGKGYNEEPPTSC